MDCTITLYAIPILFSNGLLNPSMAKVGSKMTPNKNLMQYLRAVWIFLCGILIFLFPGCTQHILKVLKKYICKFLKYSKINSLGSILTPGWATVCAKKIIWETRENIKLSLWIFIYKGIYKRKRTINWNILQLKHIRTWNENKK